MTIEISNLTRPGQSTTLTRASAQWRDRPADERFLSIEEWRAAAHRFKDRSSEEVIDLSRLRLGYDGDEILVNESRMSNWAFSQLSSRLKAPASYLRTLPPDLALLNMKHGLAANVVEGEQALLLNGPSAVSAFTGVNYPRIWNAEIADWIAELQEAQPFWTFPTAFKTASGSKENAWGEQKELPVAFMSDRDCFVFLCDYEHGIEVPGAPTVLSRGFWVENNEVGAGSVKITMFLFDFVCSNVLVWGARNVVEVKVAHRGRARERVLFEDSEARQAIVEYANASDYEDTLRIHRAQKTLVADTPNETVEVLYSKRLPGLTKSLLTDAVNVAVRTERYQFGEGPTSVWAVINGITEVSQRLAHADARIEVDRSAARIFDAMVPLES